MMMMMLIMMCCLDFGGVSAHEISLCLDGNSPINCPTAQNLSDPEDCTNYYICRGSSLYPRSCSPGWTFHQLILTCIDPDRPTSCASCPFDLTNYRYKDYIVYETTTTTTTPDQVKTSAATTTTARLPPTARAALGRPKVRHISYVHTVICGNVFV